jgi:hypothetical protein
MVVTRVHTVPCCLSVPAPRKLTAFQFKIAEFIGAIRGALERGVNEGGVVTEEMVSVRVVLLLLLLLLLLLPLLLLLLLLHASRLVSRLMTAFFAVPLLSRDVLCAAQVTTALASLRR